MISIAFFQSCDNADLPVHQVMDDQIMTRTDDCEDCAFADCCCSIEWISGDPTMLQICGTADGIDACTGGTAGNCEINNGGGKSFNIEADSARHFFCMNHNESFWLANVGNNSVTFELTCQHDELNPQILMLTLPAMSSSSRVYYGVDGECLLEDCF